jgi:hypothetical protein
MIIISQKMIIIIVTAVETSNLTVITSVHCSSLHETDNVRACGVEVCHTDQPTATLPLPPAAAGTGYGCFSHE